MFKNLATYKIFENKQKALTVLRKHHIKENDERFLKIKELFKNNPGYLGKFTEWYFEERIDISRLEELLKLLDEIKIDKPVDTFKKFEDLFDYIQDFEINTKINQVLKALPSRTRELANDELKSLIKLNSQWSKNIIDFYSKKGGKYKNVHDLINDTKSLITNLSGNYNLETMLKKIDSFVENGDIEIKISTPELLVLQVNNYKASCAIGSKHWCISTSESMWNSYVNPFTNQYFIYDFTKSISDKRHLIGVTVSPKGKFTSAHWSDDSSISDMTYFDSL